jgi:hypothetical protein
MRCGRRFLILVLTAGLAGAFARADDPLPAGSAVVVDVEGKEVTLTRVNFITGIRRLAWLADPNGTTEDAKKGPLAVEVRETHSTTFTKGVVTLVQVSHLEAVKYDYEKKIVNLSVKGLKESLTGTLEYKGLNVLGFDGSVDGKVTLFGGGVFGKSTIKAVKTATFSGAKALPEPKLTGTTWAIQIVQPAAKDPTLTVRNLKVLYQFPGGVERVEDGIPVRKGALLPLNGTVKRLEILATDTNTNMTAAEVETTTGPERIIIVPLTQELEKKTGTLIGFVGEVDAGWKLFPLHTIKVITLTDVKKKVD